MPVAFAGTDFASATLDAESDVRHGGQARVYKARTSTGAAIAIQGAALARDTTLN